MTLQISRRAKLESAALDSLRDVARLLLTPLRMDCRVARRKLHAGRSYLVITLQMTGETVFRSSSVGLSAVADDAKHVRVLAENVQDFIRRTVGVSLCERRGVCIRLDLPGRQCSEHEMLTSICEQLADVGVSSITVLLTPRGAMPASYSATVQFGDDVVTLDTVAEALAGDDLDRQVVVLAARLDALHIELVP